MNNINDNGPSGMPTPPPQGSGHQAGAPQPTPQPTPTPAPQPTPTPTPTPSPTAPQTAQPQTAAGQAVSPHTSATYGANPHTAAHAQHSAQSHNPQQSYQSPQGHYRQPPLTQQPAYQAASATPAPKSGGTGKTILVALLTSVLVLVIGLSGYAFYDSMTSGPSGSSTVLGSSGSSIDIDETDSTLAEAVAAKALPSVVNIDVYSSQSGSGMFGYDSGEEQTESSLGSGVVLSEDGYIITNYHVIEAGDDLEVTVGEETYKAEVVGSDPSSDIAVIKAVDASGLTPIEIGDSSNLVIGQWVMTIGSPFGLEQSVATGIVSATSRSQIMQSNSGEATVYTNLIQTDAAINPGNSGGALVDSDGKLIGINTLITSYSGNYSGVGFAIPIDYAINLAQQIIDGKTPTHAQLGVSLSTVNSSIAKRYGLSVDSGAYVSQIYKGSGAAEAGIEVGDIITKFDGKTITSASDLMLEIRSKNPGDTVSTEINRNGQTLTLDVTLGSDAETQQQSNKKSSYGEETYLSAA